MRNDRLRAFRAHLLGYAAVVAVLAAVNLFYTPAQPWFIIPMVAWGAPLAIHAAWAMDLFGQRDE